jgi:hypothetical protein
MHQWLNIAFSRDIERPTEREPRTSREKKLMLGKGIYVGGSRQANVGKAVIEDKQLRFCVVTRFV